MKTRINAATESFDLSWDYGYRVPDVSPRSRAKGTENIWFMEQVPLDELNKAVTSFLHSGQHDRPQTLCELVDLSRRGTRPLGGIQSSLDLILSSGIHGRVSAAIEFLAQLGSLSLVQLAATEGIHGKCGYALVRALGILNETEAVLRFVNNPDDSVREAVAEALDDIGGTRCAQVLLEMRDNDASPFIRRLALELLQDQ
jgi:hypothetical protein